MFPAANIVSCFPANVHPMFVVSVKNGQFPRRQVKAILVPQVGLEPTLYRF